MLKVTSFEGTCQSKYRMAWWKVSAGNLGIKQASAKVVGLSLNRRHDAHESASYVNMLHDPNIYSYRSDWLLSVYINVCSGTRKHEF